MIPSSRQQLIEYCLRKLGHPVIEINLDVDQIEDRIDEAFQTYREFHYDSMELVYIKEKITANTISNQYVTLNDGVTGVNRILPFSSKTTSSISMFDVRYQIILNDFYSLQSTDLIYYSQIKTHLQLIQDLFVGQKPIRFNRHQNRLYIDFDWKNDIQVDDFIIIEAYQILDPNTYTDVYNDGFLKKYATALLKQQWGNNLKKFEGVQLPGGVTLNGQKIFDEATEEIANLKQELQSTYQLPIDMFIG